MWEGKEGAGEQRDNSRRVTCLMRLFFCEHKSSRKSDESLSWASLSHCKLTVGRNCQGCAPWTGLAKASQGMEHLHVWIYNLASASQYLGLSGKNCSQSGFCRVEHGNISILTDYAEVKHMFRRWYINLNNFQRVLILYKQSAQYYKLLHSLTAYDSIYYNAEN